MSPSKLAKVRAVHSTHDYREVDAYWALGWEIITFSGSLFCLGWMGELPPVRPA